MSQHNELQKYPALQRALTVASGMDPQQEGVTRLGETLTPVMDPWSLPEWFFLRDEALLSGFAGQGATAGEFSAVAIVNPGGSGRILVVERVVTRVTAAMAVNAGFALESGATGTLGTLNAVFGRDTRLTSPNFLATPGQNVAQSRLINGSDPATAFVVSVFENRNFLAASIGADADLAMLPVIVEPGFAYVVIGTTVNVGLTCHFNWRERKVQPAEQ